MDPSRSARPASTCTVNEAQAAPAGVVATRTRGRIVHLDARSTRFLGLRLGNRQLGSDSQLANRANHSLTGSGQMVGNVEIEGRTAEFWQRSKNALAQVSARRHA